MTRMRLLLLALKPSQQFHQQCWVFTLESCDDLLDLGRIMDHVFDHRPEFG